VVHVVQAVQAPLHLKHHRILGSRTTTTGRDFDLKVAKVLKTEDLGYTYA
jgi:hypothetical protein